MPINVHEVLYFEKPTTITTYSDIPNAKPDISRFIHGQKPYPSTGTAMQKVQKKIIVNLRIRDTLGREKQKAYDQRVQQLQNDGFSIYYYHNNQLNHYDVDSIDNAPISDDFPTIEQLSQIFTIPVDELFVIDENIIDFFVTKFDAVIFVNNVPDDSSEIFSICSSELFSICSKEKIQSVIIIKSTFTKNNKMPLSEIDAFISEFPAIKHLSLPEMHSKDVPHLTSFHHLSALETLDLHLFNSNITSAQLAEILSKLKIRVLDLSYCRNIKDNFPDGMNFSGLKALEALKVFDTPIPDVA